MPTTLGIHSNVTSGGFTGGHAWISLSTGGMLKYYGLWPDEHPSTPNNGPGFDIRVGLEKTAKAAASRYYELSAEQEALLSKLLKANVTWGYTHNCSSWAHDIIRSVVKEDVDADEYLWFVETPRELGRNIRLLEAKDLTSRTKPKKANAAGGSSSF